jgi:hypothetical protein
VRESSLKNILLMLALTSCGGLAVGQSEHENGVASPVAEMIPVGGQSPSPPPAPRVRNDIIGIDQDVPAPSGCDLAITEVAVFQSVKATLWKEGTIIEGGPALVAGKSTLFRVFVSPGPHWANKIAKARLILSEPKGSNRVFETEKLMVEPSRDGNGSSTYNFSISGSAINSDTRYQVELDMGESCRRFEASRSAPRQGPLLVGAVTVPPIEIVLVPIAYDADKSHRLPDLSQQRLDQLSAAMLAMLPVHELKLSVRDPIAIDLPLEASSFPMYLDRIRALRVSDAARPQVHYMGIVMPAATLGDYCKGSCTAGLAFGNILDEPNLRVGVSLGFPGAESTRTFIHELGHTLGLKHAPCNTSDAVDPSYPYEGGLLGVWGYDDRQKQLRDPSSVGDFMGYCSDHWISDYSYNKILSRVRSLAPKEGTQALSVGVNAKEPMTSLWVPHVGPVVRGATYPTGTNLGGARFAGQWQPLLGPPADVAVQPLPIEDAQGHLWLVPTRLLNQPGELSLPGAQGNLIFPLR